MQGSKTRPVRRWAELADWFESPLGKELLNAEAESLDDVLGDLFGYHLLQVGCPGKLNLARASRTLRQFSVDLEYSSSECGACLAEPEYLPILSDCIDVAILPHTLEFCADPYQTLREIDRVLIAEGHLVICGFNPMSHWGVRRFVERKGRAPWSGRFLRLGVLREWLSVLGFELRRVEHFFYAPPLSKPKLAKPFTLLDRSGLRRWPILAGGYLILARKRVSTITPIKPRWSPKRRLASARIVEPTSRNANGHG